nr:zinc finger BED domain-containing protein RICESLEEPER 2-like [Ipomoea batatas]
MNEINDGGVNEENLDVNDDGEQNENIDVGDEKGDDEKECEKNDDQNQFQRKKRKRVSKAHADFSEVTSNDGSIKLQCIHCKTLLSKSSSATTSHLWNHLSRCIQKKLHSKNQKTLQFQNAKSKFETPPLSDGKYDHMKQREAIAHWILMHEQPLNVVENYGFTFMFKVNLPQFEKVSRAMAKNDVIIVYDIEKKKLQLMLRTINKISLTTDIWKSKVQKVSYMCVTGHFVDSNWQLQKRVLSFMPLPPPHTGVDIIDGVMKSTKDWGIEHKIFTISVDNASNNDVAVRIAKETFSRSHTLPLGVDFAFNQIYNANDARINVIKVRDALHDLFYEYVEIDNMKSRKGSSYVPNAGSLSITSSCSASKGKVVLSDLSLYDKYLDTVEDVTPNKSELDIYLEEGVYRCQDG